MRALTFLIVAYGYSWGLWYLASPYLKGPEQTVLLAIYMFGPLVGALVAGRLFDRGHMAERIGFRWRVNLWWLFAWFSAGAIVFGAAAASLLVPGVELQPPWIGIKAAIEAAGQTPPSDLATSIPPLPTLVLIAMLAGMFPNAIAAFGEEAGWRGYLWSELRGLGFWPATLVVGVLWGLWHAPVVVAGHNYGVDYEGFPEKGILFITAMCVGFSPILGYLRDRTGSSIPAAIFHGTMNATAGLSIVLLAGGDAFTRGITGVPGLIVLAAVTALVALVASSRGPRE